MITDYFAYERAMGRSWVAPRLLEAGALRPGMQVLDVGCGYGGVLAGMADAMPGFQGRGIDRDGAMIEQGNTRMPAGVMLEAGDFLAWEGEASPRFDLIVMRDVLEHIVDYPKALALGRALLRPQGCLYLTFAPFLGPFGGHQHNASGFAAHCPWVHLLPTPWVRHLLRVQGNSYKGRSALASDLADVFATRLTWKRFRQAAGASGLRLAMPRFYLSRPEYGLKFGLPALALPNLPLLREALATGIEVLARRADSPSPTA